MNLSANHGSHPELELIQLLPGEGETILTPGALSFLDEFLTLPDYQQLKD